MKHAGKRDVPHPRVKTVEHFTDTARAHGRIGKRRIAKADGTSFAVGPGVVPRRPPICMLFEDLAQGDAQPTGVFGMYPAALIPKLLPWLRARWPV